MKVEAIKCPVCKDTIYSRSRHDYHYCTCESVAIDGGRDYTKTSWDPKKCGPPEAFEIELPYTHGDLYFDWSNGIDALGTIHDPDFRRDYVYYIPELNKIFEHPHVDLLKYVDVENSVTYDVIYIGVL